MGSLLKYYGIDWLWSGDSIYGIYLLAKKNKYGFIFLMISDSSGFYMAYATSGITTFLG